MISKKKIRKLGMEGNVFSLTKLFTKKKPVANIILKDEILKSFPRI